MRRRPLLRWFWRAFLIYLAVSVPLGIFLTWRVGQEIRRLLPPPSHLGSLRWSWPFGVVIQDLTITDPVGGEPFLAKIKRVSLRVPWWGFLIRPVPAFVRLDSPHLKINSDNVNLLIGQMQAKPQEWLLTPFMETMKEGESEPVRPFASLPFIPIGIKITEGHLEVIEKEIREDQPIFIIGHLNLTLGVTAWGAQAGIRLVSHGNFVTPEGEAIGLSEADIRAVPLEKSLQGTIRLRYENLADFRNLYKFAPRQIYIQSGIADFLLEFWLTNAKHLLLKASCTVQNLQMEGKVGEVTWEQIMRAVEDERGIYSWSFTAEGNLSDPKFDPHDYILSQVEWAMKEKAASRGLKILDQMFFYADNPGVEE